MDNTLTADLCGIADAGANLMRHEREVLLSAAKALKRTSTGPLKLDTERQVFFYEQDHYYLSNFSAFRLNWAGLDFDTSEHAYHWYRFNGCAEHHQQAILRTRSAHDAFSYAQANKGDQRPGWDQVKVSVMRDILRAKVDQHEYVRRKLLQTGNRELIENSWRDPFWGWGEDRDGLNMLGKVWMEIRAELRNGPARHFRDGMPD
jgi:ribA/ribD-fused uncharacterized protein